MDTLEIKDSIINQRIKLMKTLRVFLLFFIILKIFPVNKAEKISGAIGVIAEDIVAGLMAGTILLIFNILG